MAAQESDAVAALEKLAAELSSRGFDPVITTTTTTGGRPALVVSNPRVPALSENILADGDWLLWPWADRIGQVTELGAVADTIACVLATGT
jgi:hypothetical protein